MEKAAVEWCVESCQQAKTEQNMGDLGPPRLQIWRVR